MSSSARTMRRTAPLPLSSTKVSTLSSCGRLDDATQVSARCAGAALNQMAPAARSVGCSAQNSSAAEVETRGRRRACPPAPTGAPPSARLADGRPSCSPPPPARFSPLSALRSSRRGKSPPGVEMTRLPESSFSAPPPRLDPPAAGKVSSFGGPSSSAPAPPSCCGVGWCAARTRGERGDSSRTPLACGWLISQPGEKGHNRRRQKDEVATGPPGRQARQLVDVGLQLAALDALQVGDSAHLRYRGLLCKEGREKEGQLSP